MQKSINIKEGAPQWELALFIAVAWVQCLVRVLRSYKS